MSPDGRLAAHALDGQPVGVQKCSAVDIGLVGVTVAVHVPLAGGAAVKDEYVAFPR